jgi:predicted nucleic acid-binding protein
MPINYAVQADVIDIRNDNPQLTDAFLVDTNIWFWVTYTRASTAPTPPRRWQLATYPGYLGKCLAAKSRLHRCGLSLAELAHLIEKTEREIFEASSGTNIGTKEFRHNQVTERATVVAEVQSVWGQVKALASVLDTNVDDPTTDAALARFQTQSLDGYDLFILEAHSKAGLIQVLTDDGDFCSVPGIQVFTANANVINAATSQGKLLRR